MYKRLKMLAVYFLFALLILISGLSGGCAGVPVSEEEVLAKVGADEIGQEDIQDFLNVIYLFMPEVEELYSDADLENLEDEVLWFLIESKLLQQEIDKLGLNIREDEVEEGFQQTREELINLVYESEDNFNSRLAELSIKEDVFRLVSLDAHLRELLYEYIGSSITEENARQFVEENPHFLESPAYVYVYHILLEEEEEAEQVRKLVEEGADFVEVGQEYSLDEYVELGRVSSQDMLDPQFLEAAFELEPGEISLPVKTSFGYHIIMITEKEEARELSFEEVKDDALDLKKQISFDEYLQKLIMEADVETFTE